MLSLSPASRRRLASGGAVVAALAVAGLGLTASGSSAAAISAGVREAVAQTVPPAPPAPPVMTTPAASTETSTTTTTTTDSDKGPHAVRKVVIVKDGKTTTYEGADIDKHLAAGDRVSIAPLDPHGSRMIFKVDGDPETRVEVQDIPAISSANCGIGTGKPTSMTVESGKGPKRKIVICTDRIRMVTADAVTAATQGKSAERNAYAHALAGLLEARRTVAAEAGMTDVDRARALNAIEQSIIEMKAQLARVD